MIREWRAEYDYQPIFYSVDLEMFLIMTMYVHVRYLFSKAIYCYCIRAIPNKYIDDA